MNLDQINKTWNAFSKLQNIELKYKERNQGNIIQSHYLINYTNEIATFSFIGILWKSIEGQNTDKTSIIVEFENRLDINNFKLETLCKPNHTSTQGKTTKFEESIVKNLKKVGGNSITLKDNFIRIDTDHIFSSIEEFELVSDLISMIKKTHNS